MSCRSIAAILFWLSVAGCTWSTPTDISMRLQTLMPADAILLGEQHDAPEHQRIHREVIETLAARGRLAAVALEMAPQGGTTIGLPPEATEAQVQAALRWADGAWPWRPYAPAIMAAVRADVPVLGANLPRARMREAMSDTRLDTSLPESTLKALQQAVRLGHCALLPDTQIMPMTRIQIARDRAIAQTLAALAAPGKTVLLLAGSAHVDRRLGVPQHLPASLRTKTVTLRTGRDTDDSVDADMIWATPAPAPKDYCGDLRRRMAGS